MRYVRYHGPRPPASWAAASALVLGIRNPQPEIRMSSLSVGLLGGLLFGAIAVLSMLPLSFSDKRAALTAAFLNRFAIGFAIGAAHLAWPGWAVGLTFGLLLSVPDAIITKAWGPIIGMGAVGGVLIGVAVRYWGSLPAAA